MKKWAILAVAVLSVGGIGTGLATGDGKQQKVKTKVTAKAAGGDPATGIKGRVKARRHGHSVGKCKKRRKVVVKHAGAKVGADKTNRRGRYSVAVDAYSEPGKYKVKAKKKNPKGPLVCKKGKKKVTL